MAKDKKGTKAAAAAPVKDKKASKPIETVKAGRVTKSSDKKAGSKETAKKAAKEVEKSGKKSKKSKKEPTPSSSSSEEDDDDSSDESSDSESEAEAKPAPKANGKAKAAKKEETSDSSSESDSSEDEAPAPKTNGTAKAAAKDDSSDSDSSSDDEEETKAGAADAEMKDASDSSNSSDSDESDSEEAPKAKANGAAKEDSSADSDDSDDSSDSDSEEEEKPKAEEKPSKKRKAETEAEPTTKKPKVMVNGEEKEATGNLFVGNLSWNIDEEWLTREFEEFGEIQGVRIITDKDSGRSKGFGYVEFTTPEAGAKALEARLGYELDGRELRVDFSAPRGEKSGFDNPRERQDARAARFGDTKNPPASTLFVGNISFDADESVLTEVFQEFGSINSIRLPTDRETGAPKGFGYVEMGSTEEAQAAYDGLQGADVSGRPVRLDFAAPRADNGGGGRGGGFRGGRGGGDRGGRGGGGFRGGRGGFGDRGGRGGGRGRGAPRGRGATTNRGGFGDFSGQKKTFD